MAKVGAKLQIKSKPLCAAVIDSRQDTSKQSNTTGNLMKSVYWATQCSLDVCFAVWLDASCTKKESNSCSPKKQRREASLCSYYALLKILLPQSGWTPFHIEFIQTSIVDRYTFDTKYIFWQQPEQLKSRLRQALAPRSFRTVVWKLLYGPTCTFYGSRFLLDSIHAWLGPIKHAVVQGVVKSDVFLRDSNEYDV